MEQQRIGQAVVSAYACPQCHDTGIITGSADLDGMRVMILSICIACSAAADVYEQNEVKE